MVIIAGYMLVDARVAGAVVCVCACDRHGAQPGSCCARARGSQTPRRPGSEVSRKPRPVIRPGDGTLYGDARRRRATVRELT